MRLAAIINIWNDWDWLEISVKNLEGLVNGVIVVASEKSNYGEISPIPEAWKDKVHIREPFFNHPLNCETDKRNFGLDLAKQQGYTHFISMDADELYEREAFLAAKERFHVEPGLIGLVCETQVYFGSVHLTIGKDVTLVPFIHKIVPGIKHEFNRRYPYAWDNGKIRIDPSRSLSITSGVKIDSAVMHHYSWVRKDYQKKIRNSTAKNNLLRSSILKDLVQPTPGKFIEFYQRSLVQATVDFNIDDKIFTSTRQGLQPYST